MRTARSPQVTVSPGLRVNLRVFILRSRAGCLWDAGWGGNKACRITRGQRETDRKKEPSKVRIHRRKRPSSGGRRGTCRRPVPLRLTGNQKPKVKLLLRGSQRMRRGVVTRRAPRSSAAAGDYGGWRGRGGPRILLWDV